MILLDTSFLISFFSAKDTNHERALSLMNEIIKKQKYGKDVFITDYIFDECATVALARSKNLGATAEFGEYLLGSEFIVLKIDSEIIKSAWEKFKRGEISSFTDCTSIAALQSYRIEKIATFDEGFKKIANIEVIN